MEDVKSGTETILHLRELGIRVHIDDFGTGYSSLRYLRDLPASTIKIDRDFVKEIDDNGNHAGIVQTIVSLAHNLGMNVVAEGIETEQQLAYLQDLGCEFGQGFLIARPMDPDAVPAFLSERSSLFKTKPTSNILLDNLVEAV